MFVYYCLTVLWLVMACAYRYHPKDDDNRYSDHSDNYPPKHHHNVIFDAAKDLLMTSNHKFSADMLTKAVKHHSDTFVISASSAFCPLSLLALAAEGQTKMELFNALDFDESDDPVYTENMLRAANVVANTLGAQANGIQIKRARGVYVPSFIPIHSYFEKITIAGLDTQLRIFDYSPQTVMDINTWVSNQTNNKIVKLLGLNDIDMDTQLVIVDAVYFTGQWETPFDSKNTNYGTFYATAANSSDSDTSSLTEILFMTQQETFGYSRNDQLDAKILEIRYADRLTDASFVIILPNNPNGLNSLLHMIKDPKVVRQALKALTPTTVHVSIPKFQIETETDLKEILQENGVRRVFEPSAELPNLLNHTAGWPTSHRKRREITTTKEVKLVRDIPVDIEIMLRARPANRKTATRSTAPYVTKAIQKVYISVSETGTEGAGGTALIGGWTLPVQPHTKSFKANHPFVFLIRQHKLILFSGIFDPYGERRKSVFGAK